ncbi:MAG: DsbA family protein [Patescibacteria group bacterium]
MAPGNRPWYRKKWLIAVLIVGAVCATGLIYFGAQTVKYIRLISAGQLDVSIAPRDREVLARIREVLSGPRPTATERGRIEIAEGNPVLGNPKAKVKIVEFLDYQCPFSKSISGGLREFMQRHKDEAFLIVRDYPVSDIHEHAEGAARAARCVLVQGQERYWIFHAALFLEQDNLAPERLRVQALKAGVDPEAYDACLKSAATAQAVNQSFADGVLSGVVGTPTFFFNGYAFPGIIDGKTFEAVYQEVVKKL